MLIQVFGREDLKQIKNFLSGLNVLKGRKSV